MELGPRQSEYLGKQFKTFNELGHKKFMEGRDFDIAVIKEFSIDYLRKNHKKNEGNNGVIFKLELQDPNNENETVEYAGKLLKVGSYEDLKAEYDNQIAAYEILEEEIANGADPSKYSKIPRPCFCFHLELDDELKKHLQEEGIKSSGDTQGLLLMDWIDGEDVATHLFKEALKRKESRFLETIKQGDFNQLHQAVGLEFEFAKPGGKATRAGDKIFEERKVAADNESKIYRFLKKSGYIFPKNTLEQIRNTLDLFSSKGLEMWDSHARNVMLDPEGDRPYLIDFAPQKKQLGGEAATLDPYVLIRQLESLTTTPQEDHQAEIESKFTEWDANYQKKTQDPRWVAAFINKAPTGEKFLKHAQYEIASGVDEDRVQGNIYALFYKANQNEISPEAVLGLLTELSSKENLPWKKAKIDLAIKKAGK